MANTNFFAVDLGATSGRTILGSIVNGKLEQRELTRFPNNIIQVAGHCFWDIFALYNEIVRGLKLWADEGIDLTLLAKLTKGMSASDIEHLVNAVALEAAYGQENITYKMLSDQARTQRRSVSDADVRVCFSFVFW